MMEIGEDTTFPILVGHSLRGEFARTFAGQHPVEAIRMLVKKAQRQRDGVISNTINKANPCSILATVGLELFSTVEWGPTLSVGGKILVAVKAAHHRQPQSVGDNERQLTEGLRQRSLSSRWAISLLRCIPLIVYTPPLLSRYCGTSVVVQRI